MSCIGDAFCPECREIIYGNGCMCGLACDRGEPRHSCAMDAPDGVWPRRMYGQAHPNQFVETRNGWQVGWTMTIGGEWQRREPSHPTKSPSQLRWGEALTRPVIRGPWQESAIVSDGGGI